VRPGVDGHGKTVSRGIVDRRRIGWASSPYTACWVARARLSVHNAVRSREQPVRRYPESIAAPFGVEDKFRDGDKAADVGR
jgi:hypothetical protein